MTLDNQFDSPELAQAFRKKTMKRIKREKERRRCESLQNTTKGEDSASDPALGFLPSERRAQTASVIPAVSPLIYKVAEPKLGNAFPSYREIPSTARSRRLHTSSSIRSTRQRMRRNPQSRSLPVIRQEGGGGADGMLGGEDTMSPLPINDWTNGLDVGSLKYKRSRYKGRKPPNRLERSYVRPKRLNVRKRAEPRSRYHSPRTFLSISTKKAEFAETFHPKYLPLTQNPAYCRIQKIVNQNEKQEMRRQQILNSGPFQDYRNKLTFEMRPLCGDIYATMLTKTARRRNPMLAQE